MPLNQLHRTPPPALRRQEGEGTDSQITRWLDNLGRLPSDFDGNSLLPLLSHKREKIRRLAAANLGKLSDLKFLPRLLKAAEKDGSTTVRREATSAIGRMRNAKTIPALVRLTRDNDPKVVLQALRGLLAFAKKTTCIHETLERLAKHPNEMVRELIVKERSDRLEDTVSRRQHIESPDFMKNLVVHGDVLQTLKHTPAESIHLTFTSPPYYNARDYSIYTSYA